MIPRTEVPSAFNIFHDGTITHVELRDGACTLQINIPYLANRIERSLTNFCLTLEDATIFRFLGWPKSNEKKEKEEISDFEEIFSADLDILESSDKGEFIEIICNIADPKNDFCGGELHLDCTKAKVVDERSKDWEIEDLKKLCEEYWNDMQKK